MYKKNFLNSIACLLICMFTFNACTDHKQTVTEDTTLNEKKVYPWYIARDGGDFKDIEPYKDMLACISVFGKLGKDFIDQCHANQIEVYHAVGGRWVNIDTPEERTQLIQEYVDYCVNENYDGIDLDFEHLPAQCQPTYSEFLREASNALHAIGKKMSHCVGYHPAAYDNPDAKVFCDPIVLNETCDLVRVMCYDMFFGPGVDKNEFKDRYDCSGVGPTSDYPWTIKAMTQWSRHIAKEKLVMALPAYGNDYSLGKENMKGRQIYACVPDSAKGVLPAPKWNYYSRLNMYIYDGLDGNKHIFYASDAQSTSYLLQLADELGISKIGFWHYASVSKDMWQVTKQWTNQ